MKLETAVAFATGISVGSAITTVEIVKAISKVEKGNKEEYYQFVKKRWRPTNYCSRFYDKAISNFYNKAKRQKEEGEEVLQVCFDTREEACELVLKLIEIIYKYGSASVDDYYDLIGIYQQFRLSDSSEFGWKSLTPCDYSIEYDDIDDSYTLTLAEVKRL